MARLNVAIIGTGSLACLFGARLSKVARVTVIGTWQAQIEAICRHGVAVEEMTGDRHLFTVDARRFPFADETFTLADIALVLVKSFQNDAAASRISKCLKPNGVVLSLQNGLGNKEALASRLPRHNISCGVTMQAAHVQGLGIVSHAGDGVTVLDNKPYLTSIRKLFRASNVPVTSYDQVGCRSIDEMIYRKAIISASVNPLTALLGQRNGFLTTDETSRRLCVATAQEAARIGQLDGSWPVEKDGAHLGVEAAELTAANRSSMLQDISRGESTEIAAICGEIVKRAKEQGVEAPINQTWLGLITLAGAIEGGTKGAQLYKPIELLQKVKRYVPA